MSSVRVIPRLDIKGPNLVKGIQLEGLRVLGRPEQFARYYYEAGADELIYQDVVASLYGRNSLCEIISRTAREIFIPLTVGGGLRSLDDISRVLAAGADKVCINTAAISDPELIQRAARRFGSSTIVVAVEVIRQPDGQYLAYTDNGRQHTGVDAVEWAARAEEQGAGELLITSVDQEGTGRGFDIELNRRIARSVSIPVIAHGGAGQLEHVSDVVLQADVDAVAIGGMLHYEAVEQLHCGLQAGEPGNTEFLKGRRCVTHVAVATLGQLKCFLEQREIPCRMEVAV